ncbi:MAG TPA: hypothetical protein VGI12_05805 [Vicinamibacterales bacterium]|jgi:chromosome segregation ATPase
MVKAAVAAAPVDVEAIDRLEQKLKQLVTVLDQTRAESTRANGELAKARGEQARASEEMTRTRAEQVRAAEENTRLRAELDAARGRLAEAEGTGTELAALRTERDHVRGRVDEMLKQLESLNL